MRGCVPVDPVCVASLAATPYNREMKCRRYPQRFKRVYPVFARIPLQQELEQKLLNIVFFLILTQKKAGFGSDLAFPV